MSETVDTEGLPVRYLVPIPAFTVPGPWAVGNTTLYPIEAAPELLAGSPPARFRGGGDIGPEIDRVLEQAAAGTIAEVRDASDSKEAVAAVRAALDVLRLFSCSRFAHTLPFGLPGDLAHGIVNYVAAGKVSAPG